MTDNVAIITKFIEAWSRLDVDELVGYFTEDGTYYNMPAAPVSGHAALKQFIGAFVKDWTRTDWDVLNIIGSGIFIINKISRTYHFR